MTDSTRLLLTPAVSRKGRGRVVLDGLAGVGTPHGRSISLLYLFRRAARSVHGTRSARPASLRIPREIGYNFWYRRGFSPPQALRVCLIKRAARELGAKE